MDKIKVMIDPGHGGKDRYNVGPTGYVEADGVLKISQYLREELNSTGSFIVMLTRETDTFIEVRERGNMAAQWGAMLFISEHTNAYNQKARGTVVYESVDLPDEVFAADMAFEIAKVIGVPNRGCAQWESKNYPGEDYLGVIDAAQDGGVPHVLLVEAAFHDHPEDEAILKADKNLQMIAQAQARVICKFFGVNYNKIITMEEALDVLTEKGVIQIPEYWLKNARPDHKVAGEYAAILIMNAANKLNE